MPFLKRQVKKKLNPQYVEDPSARNNFEVIYDNISEIFKRMDRQRWANSESSSGAYTKVGPVFEKPPTLKVKLINCTGKKPVLVFMRQQSELVSNAGTTGGGILIANTTTAGGLGYFLIGNATQRRVIHGVTLGGIANTLGAPIVYELYYPASSVLAVDLTPEVGINEYEIIVAAATVNETIYLQDCELFAVELF